MDVKKAVTNEKAPKTINFDYIVLRRLEDRARAEGITVSKLANEIIRRSVMDDNEFYLYMSKIHAAMMRHYQVLGGMK